MLCRSRFGFVLDDAVVVIENIVRHMEEGASPFEASLKGAGEIGSPSCRSRYR